MPTITVIGTGANTRISPDPAVSGGRLSPNKQTAGLAANQFISPDPATAAAQLASVQVQ